jgi:hypothetical protein
MTATRLRYLAQQDGLAWDAQHNTTHPRSFDTHDNAFAHRGGVDAYRLGVGVEPGGRHREAVPGPDIDPRPEGLHVAVLRVEHALGPAHQGSTWSSTAATWAVRSQRAWWLSQSRVRSRSGLPTDQADCTGVNGVVTV